MLKSYKYKLNPTYKQKMFFEQTFGCCRFIYNWALDLKIKTYQEEKKTLSQIDLMNKLPDLKKQEEYKWLKETSSDSLQQSIKNMDAAFVRFFREKKGFPKFKSKRKSKNSFKFVNPVQINFDNHKVKLPKIGWVNYFNDGRVFDGKIGTVTVSKDSCGYYYISILVDNYKDLPQRTKVVDDNKTIGIDVGIKTFVTTNDGIKFDNPRHLEQLEQSLKVHQRRLSKKVKNSGRYKRQRKRIAKLHYKINNQRNYFIHSVTNYLVDNYDSIIIEDLNVEGMMKNHHLAKSISSVAWSELFRQLEYKCEWKGKNLIRIGRFDASSQHCSKCGYKNIEVKNLVIREWECPHCKERHDRDINAACNIRGFGLSKTNLIGQ